MAWLGKGVPLAVPPVLGVGGAFGPAAAPGLFGAHVPPIPVNAPSAPWGHHKGPVLKPPQTEAGASAAAAVR